MSTKKQEKKSEPETQDVSPPPSLTPPASVVVADPTSSSPKISFPVWMLATKKKPTSIAGFRAWLGAKADQDRTLDEWNAVFVTFQSTPVK